MNINIKSYEDYKANIASKELHHFYYIKGNSYQLVAVDGALYYTHDLEVDDKEDYDTNLAPAANKKLGSFYQREPFATKLLASGEKLFRRKHGQKITVPANDSADIIFTVPYGKAKINKLELIAANPLDRVDLLVKSPLDPATAAAYGMPADYLLNQFGFGVVVCELLYSDKSDYDAEVYAGMQVICKYYNDTAADKEVGANLIYHEMKEA